MAYIIECNEGYLVCGEVFGEQFEELFDMLYEAEALKAQIEILSIKKGV